MKFKKMNLLELVEFWNKDWQKETAELENVDTMRSWDTAVNAVASESSELEILQALHSLKSEEYVETVYDLKLEFFERFASLLIEEVKELRISVEVLLKEHETEPARITIGQLNRLKGGIR